MFDFLKSKREPPVLPAGTVRRRYQIFGRVQGVGFRYRAKYAAQSLYLTGWVQNETDGSVTMEVQGLPEQIDQMFPLILQGGYIQITDMRVRDISPDPWEKSFGILDYYY